MRLVANSFEQPPLERCPFSFQHTRLAQGLRLAKSKRRRKSPEPVRTPLLGLAFAPSDRSRCRARASACSLLRQAAYLARHRARMDAMNEVSYFSIRAQHYHQLAMEASDTRLKEVLEAIAADMSAKVATADPN